MAEKSSQKSIWVTLGAAMGTVVVILGIAAGPTAVSCASDDAGFGTCVRERLADFGLLKQPSAPPVAEPAAVAAASADASAEKETVSEATENDAVAVETPAEPAPVSPSLGLVRAEPNGDLVIAGSAAPGARVAVYADDVLLGETTAEASGDWVLVPDAPLAPGGAEITVRAPDMGLVAEQSVVVVIQDDLTTEPLVVAGAPGQASKVLQGLAPVEAEPAPTEMVADAGNQSTGEVVPADDEGATESAAPDNEAADETIVVAEVPETAASAVEAPPADVPATEDVPVAPESLAIPEETDDVAVATATDTAAPEAAPADVPTAPAADVVIETTEPVPSAETAPAVAVVPPSIDAIEVDGERNFFAGSGPEGATVRLYVEDEFVADSAVSNGRWLVETTTNFLTAPSQRVRVDMLNDGSADVIARAEVDFEITLPDLPDVEAPLVVAEAPTTEAVNRINGVAATNNSDVLAEAPTISSAPETMEQPIVEAATPPATPAVETATADDMAAPADTNEVAGAEANDTMADSSVPTLKAVAVGDPEAQRFASGKAIIRSGDNLWTIAGRVYGSGYRYLTIYRANQGQIKNPNLIYPGQVFELPTE